LIAVCDADHAQARALAKVHPELVAIAAADHAYRVDSGILSV
jgi:hypothetical protein